MSEIKLVVIGGGSSYSPELVDGIIKRYTSLPVKELILVDIERGREKTEINCALSKRMFEKAGINVDVKVSLDRRAALAGADFIITQLRIGGLEAREKDEMIPLKYDLIGQETTGPGGFANALRTIPVMLEICRDIEELCPEAWLINFTNPSGIVTEAVLGHSKVKCIGLCNIALNTEQMLQKYLKVDKSRLRCVFVGLNHLSIVKNVYLDGKDILPELLTQNVGGNSLASNIPDIDFPEDFLSMLGYVPSSYLRYFYFEEQMLREEKARIEKGIGSRAAEVMNIEKKLFAIYRDQEVKIKPAELSKRGGALYSEAAISVIDSLHNNKPELHVVNTLNRGAISDLPADCVVETNCLVNREGAIPLVSGALPENFRGLAQQVNAYEQLTIKAAVTGDRGKALMALINNPLTHDAAVARELLDELIEAHGRYLSYLGKGGKK